MKHDTSTPFDGKISDGEIYARLSTRFMGRSIFLYDSCTSTNQCAAESFPAPDGSVFVAECQTAGRGRRGRSWSSDDKGGIYMSLLLKPHFSPAFSAPITLVAGLAVCTATRSLCRIDAAIKWPNDIVCNGKKICGILSEISTEKGQIKYITIGIGINVNNDTFGTELSEKATSLLIETGKSFSRAEIIAEVLNRFEKYYVEFSKNGFAVLKEEYEKFCITLGKEVSVSQKDGAYRAHALGISPDGGLVIMCENGVKIVSSGEVSVRGIYGYI